MRVIMFGATGMVGQGVLRECLLDGRVERILSIGRRRLPQPHPKVAELPLDDFRDLPAHEDALRGYDACFFCLGVSSVGMSEEDYHRVTYGYTLAAAGMLARLNPEMTFIYVSGMGTDSSEQGRSMWARVKGETENALLRLPFKAAYMFRPGFIQPLHGIRSRTPLYRVVYALARPFIPLLRRFAPAAVTTTEQVGRAMLRVAFEGYGRPHLEMGDINAL